MNGTPKTLLDAIENGFMSQSSKRPSENVRAAVQDYLAQRFTPDLMDDPRIAQLWKRIIEGSKDE